MATASGVASILLAVSFFARRWFFPQLFLGVGIAFALFLTVDTLVVAQLITEQPVDAEIIGTIVGRWVGLLWWGTYFYRSRRSINTFRN
ncbi:MAG: DUF2569 family protein [Opitutales bacterium]